MDAAWTGAHGGDESLIHGCVDGSGVLRIVPATAECDQGEKPLDWSIQGPAGLPGSQGAQGAPGASAKLDPEAAAQLTALLATQRAQFARFDRLIRRCQQKGDVLARLRDKARRLDMDSDDPIAAWDAKLAVNLAELQKSSCQTEIVQEKILKILDRKDRLLFDSLK